MTRLNRRALDGKVALVSAAGRGIGRAIAIGLADAGASVAINSYGEETTHGTAEAIREAGAEALPLVGDITDPETIISAAGSTIEHFGQIDILVNNVGAGPKEMPDTEPHALGAAAALWDALYDQNLRAAVLMTEAVVPAMIKQAQGKIVHVSSIAGKTSLSDRMLKFFTHPAYGAMKAALCHYTTTLAETLGPRGINVNAVCPGIVWTDSWEKNAENAVATLPQFKGQDARGWFEGIARGEYPEIFDRTPLRREQTVEDIADAVVFLSSEAARNITGQSLMVDGGMVKV
jgi:meso-butanediol dehydrogenase/(S,S)-butanediol dehydrogenase/diacetyl reductase